MTTRVLTEEEYAAVRADAVARRRGGAVSADQQSSQAKQGAASTGVILRTLFWVAAVLGLVLVGTSSAAQLPSKEQIGKLVEEFWFMTECLNLAKKTKAACLAERSSPERQEEFAIWVERCIIDLEDGYASNELACYTSLTDTYTQGFLFYQADGSEKRRFTPSTE